MSHSGVLANYRQRSLVSPIKVFINYRWSLSNVPRVQVMWYTPRVASHRFWLLETPRDFDARENVMPGSRHEM